MLSFLAPGSIFVEQLRQEVVINFLRVRQGRARPRLHMRLLLATCAQERQISKAKLKATCLRKFDAKIVTLSQCIRGEITQYLYCHSF